MHRQKNGFRFLYILFIGLAVAIISLGSLINFHQNKIWGKPLIHEFIGVKRDQDKSIKTVQTTKSSTGGIVLHDFDPGFIGILHSNLWDRYFVLNDVPVYTHDFSVPVIFLSSARGLRAPPVA